MLTTEDIGRIIRFHRKKAGLTQVQLARLAGVGKTVVFDIENGKESVRLDTLMKILAALNIRIELNSPLMAAFHERDDEKS
ncbi:MAG: helix-turn-helix transcriptional regulator [Chlorobi bacterium]|nr:helix-turn-helix transcriptional regulator [Chlorobiota bacterium]